MQQTHQVKSLSDAFIIAAPYYNYGTKAVLIFRLKNGVHLVDWLKFYLRICIFIAEKVIL